MSNIQASNSGLAQSTDLSLQRNDVYVDCINCGAKGWNPGHHSWERCPLCDRTTRIMASDVPELGIALTWADYCSLFYEEHGFFPLVYKG